MANLARFTIDAVGSSPPGYDANPGDTLTLLLEQRSGTVNRWTVQVYGPANSDAPAASKNAPLLTLVGATSGERVDATTPASAITTTLPGSRAHSWRVRSLVNGGIDAFGQPNPDYVFERVVAIRSAGGLRKVVAGEGTAYAARGVPDAQNDVVDVNPSGGGVSTVFGRGGPNVTAQGGDYAASQVLDDSSVTSGGSVKQALNALKGGLCVADGTTIINVAGTISVKDSAITNAKVSDTAAIAGTKVVPDFGAQNILTTGFIGLGATLPTTGNVRLAHSKAIVGLDSTGLNNVKILDWGVSAPDTMTFGDDLFSNGLVYRAAGGGHNFYTQTINALSVASTIVQIGVATLQFPATVSSPVSLHVNGNNPTNRAVRAQGATGSNHNGGRLLVQGGINNGTGLKRGPVLQLNVDDTEANMVNLLEVSEVIAGKRVLTLLKPAHLTTTEMPANTGDMVAFLANCVTAPTTGVPVGGGILYASGGALRWKDSNGTDAQVSQGGTPITDADQTINPGTVSDYQLATPTANRSITLGVAGALFNGFVTRILTIDNAAFTVAFLNGGTNAATMFTRAASPGRKLRHVFRWNTVDHVYLGAEVVP